MCRSPDLFSIFTGEGMAYIRLMRNILADKTQLEEDERFCVVFLRSRDRVKFDRFLPFPFTST